jgi:predicted nucleic acid-binding protein
MNVLADSGVLLRLLEPTDLGHGFAVRSVSTLESNGDVVVITGQNLAEFWSACTRPASARGRLGHDLAETTLRLTKLEGPFGLIIETQQTYAHWRQLVATFGVKGRQVHDARLVALMQSHNIDHILTFNTANSLATPA